MKFFIFGATGDLARRKVIPAIVNLNNSKLEIIALGRRDMSDGEYESFVCGDCFAELPRKPIYKQANFGENLTCEDCERQISKSEIAYFYCALPPTNHSQVIRYLGMLKSDGYQVRLLLEKPFGRDFIEAHENRALIEKFDLSNDVYLADHYLFKKEILELKPREFRKLKILVHETVGVEGRAHYDEIGALRDMVQSHFLNIAYKLLDNPFDEFKDFKILKLEKNQYEGYAVHIGKESKTETFVHLILKTKKHEFEFETGKKMPQREGFIEIDGERINLTNGGEYERMFESFIAGESGEFPSIENALLSWNVIEGI